MTLRLRAAIGVVACACGGLALLLCAAPAARADQQETRLDQVQESREHQATATVATADKRDAAMEVAVSMAGSTSPAAVFETLKKRAQQVIMKRRARRWTLTTNTTLATAIETNPNFDSSRKGDTFFEEDTDLLFRWRWFGGLTQDFGHRLTNIHYVELRDNSNFSNTLYTAWRYTPARWLRITSGYEFDTLSYYQNQGSSSDGHRVYIQARHTLPKHLYYQAGWNYSYRRYSHREARDADGVDTDDARHDTRHSMHYEVGAVVKETFLSVRQEGAWQFSNDVFQDFYDYQSYKVRATLARDFWTKWRGSGTFSFERKNYTKRQVDDNTAEAEYDNAFTYGLSLTYNLSDDVSLQYSYTRRKQDSNAPVYEFTDTTNQFSLNAAF